MRSFETIRKLGEKEPFVSVSSNKTTAFEVGNDVWLKQSW